MSNVIQFLETLGSNSAQARFSTTQYAAAVASLDLGDAQRRALLARDYAELSSLLGGRGKMMCVINAPDEEIGSDEEQEREGIARSSSFLI